MEGSERRLAAIMFTDMVGYTSLSQRNEALAMELLEEQRKLVRPYFPKHNGREVKTIGDAFLVEFASALEAVRCAFDIQQSLHELNSNRPSERKVLVRIGVHLGDVIHSQNDVYGDAVNVASRIEPLAPAGGVCITEQVNDHVKNKTDLQLVSLGRKELKNVGESIEVFRIVFPWERQEEIGAGPDKRRIAVLPFANLSSDPEEGYFADGITEELITSLSGVKQLTVIARTSVMKYKGSEKGASDVGRELKVGTLLEGSVRKAGNKVRITAQLIDTATEGHLWAQNYDRQLEDVFAIQSEIAEKVVGELKVRLVDSEKRGIEKKATESSSAYIRYLRGRVALQNRNQKDLLKAKKLFEDAISEDDGFAMAYVGLADALFLLGEYFFMPMAEARQKSKEALTNALSLDENLAEARTALANSLQHDYKFNEAVREYDLAVSLNPNYAQGHHWYPVCLWDMARYAQAFQEISKAEDPDPLSVVIGFNMAFGFSAQGERARSIEMVERIRELDPAGFYGDLAMSFILVKDSEFAEAAVFQEKAFEKTPSELPSLSRLGCLYAWSGQEGKAREILAKLEQVPDGSFGRPFSLGFVHGALGEKDEMFAFFEMAFAEHSLVFRSLIYESVRLGVREDPRYLSLLARAGLSDPHR